MKTILKNFLSIILGLLVGSAVNMGLILLSSSIIPPPEGADLSTMEGLAASMPLMEPKHFLFPFLAHALGTLVGAFLAARFSASFPRILALLVGLLFFVGGTYNVMTLPSPLWFNVVDLIGAYFPMALLGAKLAGEKPKKH